MRAFTVLLALVPAVASVDPPPWPTNVPFPPSPRIPPCLSACIDRFGSPCLPLDTPCLCNNPGTINKLSQCLPTVCSGAELDDARDAEFHMCVDNGYDPPPPPPVARRSVTPRQIGFPTNLPACAQPCMDNLTARCQPPTIQCVCADTANIDDAAQCVQNFCTGADLQNAVNDVLFMCDGITPAASGGSASATNNTTVTATTVTNAVTNTATATITDGIVGTVNTSATGTNSTVARSSASTPAPASSIVTSATSVIVNTSTHAGSSSTSATSHGAGYPAATHVVGTFMGGLVVVGAAVIGL
ncbi:hypothetical protein DB88DRAFT_526601 [Papiliotrema laurentii]|uniref:CFEM domain-containing protein n=1 Tax=Papiliotrema laurentii TaxID=5418 RepID=A0AAD9FQ62_PAPLA|nr:hypothetical protein DB88DRAFT_526601 [Papiliotrema laurentii]